MQTLIMLNLGYNGISAAGAEHLANGLSYNKVSLALNTSISYATVYFNADTYYA
jgi:hypothetical protein